MITVKDDNYSKAVLFGNFHRLVSSLGVSQHIFMPKIKWPAKIGHLSGKKIVTEKKKGKNEHGTRGITGWQGALRPFLNI